MYERKLLFVALLAATVVSTPAIARSEIYVNIGPPPPVVEVVPAPRPGYVWAPGYWGWNGHKHVWAKGHWKRATMDVNGCLTSGCNAETGGISSAAIGVDARSFFRYDALI